MLCRVTKRTSTGTVIADPAAMINRLAEYEDSECTPEEFARVKTSVEELIAAGVDFQHLKDLVKAEREFRLVVREPYPEKCCINCAHFKRNRNRQIDYSDGHLISEKVLMSGICEAKPTVKFRCGRPVETKPYSDIGSGRICCFSFQPREQTDPPRYNDVGK